MKGEISFAPISLIFLDFIYNGRWANGNSVKTVADCQPPSSLDKELYKYRSIALRAKVASFQNRGLCFVEVPGEESASSGVSLQQHAITPVVRKSEQNTIVTIVQKRDIFSRSQGIPEPLDSLYM